MLKKFKNEKGITKMQFVIIIVIIVISIILASMGIIFILKDNEYIKSSESVRESYKDEDNEKKLIGAQTESETLDTTNVILELSEDGIYVPVPKGFTASTILGERKVNEGFVIKQGNNGSVTSEVNEFVWIPVDDASLGEMYNTAGEEKNLSGVLTKTSLYSNVRLNDEDSLIYSPATPGVELGLREPDVLVDEDTDTKYISILNYANIQEMADGMVEEYNTVYESIKKYNGFYIGRYELTGTVDFPTVQKGQNVITEQTWYDLKKACTNVVTGEEYGAQSTMIYGNQWDEIMDWLKQTKFKGEEEKVDVDSRSWGNYTDSTENVNTTSSVKLQKSGYNEEWKANNIYDLAGNYDEWTQEAFDSRGRVYRGCGSDYSSYEYTASSRYIDLVWACNSYGTSRPVLYIK